MRKVSSRRLLPGLLCVAAAAACAPRDEPDPGPQRRAAAPAPVGPGLTTDRTRYAMVPGPYGPQATIITTFRAPADTTAWILHCNGAIAWGLQRLVGQTWRDAWVAMTNECLSPAILVAGDSAFVDTLVFTPSAGAMIDSAGLGPGPHRLVLYNVLTSFAAGKRPFGPDLPLERRVSAPITLGGQAGP